MVMLDLFRQAGFNIGVAHCNFQLRGEESLGDEALVKQVCSEHHIPFHLQRFDTKAYCEERNVSVQMAARELRYRYFEELMREHGYQYVATAHHRNDSLETIFLNLVRGTGIDGLAGIAVQNQHVIRPMLFATRPMITAYASAHRLHWREDSSNLSDHYQRNLLRNQVVPLLKQMNPDLEEGFEDTAERIQGARSLMLIALEQFRQKAVAVQGDEIRIRIDQLMGYPHPAVLLWEIIKGFGFRYERCKKIVQEHQPGKLFLSETHRLIVDRAQLIVSRRREPLSFLVSIQQGQDRAVYGDMTLQIREVTSADFTLSKDQHLAQLDAGKVKFPLWWRPWKNGDHFYPLGMEHTKKLSDFLVNAKVPLHEKENITVLESAGDIIWIVGHRIDDRFKVRADTQRVLVIKESTKNE